MAERWFTARFSAPHEFFRILRGWGQAHWVYAERMETTLLVKWQTFWVQNLPPEGWVHGRAFSPVGEIAWWQGGENLTARAILEEGIPLPESSIWETHHPLQTADIPLGSESAWLLWKARPYQKVPSADVRKGRQQLVARIYLAPGNAFPLAHRLLRLEEVHL